MSATMAADVDNVVDKIIGSIKPAIKPEEMFGIISTYHEGVEQISKEMVNHALTNVQRSSEMLVNLTQTTDPLKRVEIGQVWMLNATKGYFDMINRIATIGHQTLGQIVKQRKQ